MKYIQIFWYYRNIEVNLNLKFSSIPTTDHFDLNFLQLFCRGTQIFIFYYYLSFSPFSFIISFLFYYCLSYRILTSHFIFSSLLFSSIILIQTFSINDIWALYHQMRFILFCFIYLFPLYPFTYYLLLSLLINWYYSW